MQTALPLRQPSPGGAGFVVGHALRNRWLQLALCVMVFVIIFVILWFTQAGSPVLFVVFSGLVFLAWGEIFSIFPALCTDTFGERNASVNFGFLHASAGVGAVFGGPIAALWRQQSGSWSSAIWAGAALDAPTAILALMLLKRTRLSYQGRAKHA